MAKYKLTVIFGSKACEYAEEHGKEKTIKALKSNRLDSLEGMFRTYELDTKEDAEQLIFALGDMMGWENYFYETKEDGNGMWSVKFDE